MRDLLAFGHRDRQPGRSPLLRTMVGDVLRRTRLEQHRTLADVAASARISMQYLSELERGRKEASSEILAALCAALRLDLSELLAAVGRDLAGQRGLPARVVRLSAFRDGDPRAGQPGLPGLGQPGLPGLGQPDLPGLGQPDLPGSGQPDLPGPAQPAVPPAGSLAGDEPGPAARRSGQPACLLAA